MNTIFRNKTGTYAPTDLAIVVWSNPKTKTGRQVRALETMTTEDSTLPIAFPIALLRRKREWKSAKFVSSDSEVYESLPSSSRTQPLIIPMTVAANALGWKDFYIPTEYTED